MSSFFDNDDEDDYSSPRRQPQAGPSRRPVNLSSDPSDRARESSVTSSTTATGQGPRSFSSRLESTLSPGPSDALSVGLEDLHSDNPLSGETSGMDSDGEEEEDLDDVRRMGRLWVRERGTVDLMPWEGELIDTLFDKSVQQQSMVDTLRSDPHTSEEEHFKLVSVQTEMERVKFVIRSYVRTRSHKIEKYSHHIVLTPESHNSLSGAESAHARRYTESLHTHFKHSVLDSLPDWSQNMDDSYGDGSSMVSKPNKDVPISVYCRKDCGEIISENGERAESGKGTTHSVKYSLVERWVSLGWAEVL